jgi:hypothetical protein
VPIVTAGPAWACVPLVAAGPAWACVPLVTLNPRGRVCRAQDGARRRLQSPSDDTVAAVSAALEALVGNVTAHATIVHPTTVAEQSGSEDAAVVRPAGSSVAFGSIVDEESGRIVAKADVGVDLSAAASAAQAVTVTEETLRRRRLQQQRGGGSVHTAVDARGRIVGSVEVRATVVAPPQSLRAAAARLSKLAGSGALARVADAVGLEPRAAVFSDVSTATMSVAAPVSSSDLATYRAFAALPHVADFPADELAVAAGGTTTTVSDVEGALQHGAAALTGVGVLIAGVAAVAVVGLVRRRNMRNNAVHPDPTPAVAVQGADGVASVVGLPERPSTLVPAASMRTIAIAPRPDASPVDATAEEPRLDDLPGVVPVGTPAPAAPAPPARRRSVPVAMLTGSPSEMPNGGLTPRDGTHA